MYNFQQRDELEEHDQRRNIPVTDNHRKSNKKAAAVAGAGAGVENVHEGFAGNNENNMKKALHRESEKQRRQDMAKNCVSLRSLLPVEYIKGKRSVSDQLLGAENYIKNLQKKISMNKEKLMKLSENVSEKGFLYSHLNVTVSLCQYGQVEVLLSNKERTRDDVVFPLSNVMKTLLVEGLDVVTCVSTVSDDTIFYRILSQGDDLSCIDVIELQKKLEDAIKQEISSF